MLHCLCMDNISENSGVHHEQFNIMNEKNDLMLPFSGLGLNGSARPSIARSRLSVRREGTKNRKGTRK